MLTTMLLDLAGAPERVATAAVIIGWLSRGQVAVAEMLAAQRAAAATPIVASLFDMALGACGVYTASIQTTLAHDAATGGTRSDTD